jgi:hypothetical protein
MNGLGYDRLVRGHNLSWYDLVGKETGGVVVGVYVVVMVLGVRQHCHAGCRRDCWEAFQTGLHVGYADVVVAIQ